MKEKKEKKELKEIMEKIVKRNVVTKKPEKKIDSPKVKKEKEAAHIFENNFVFSDDSE